MIKSFVLSFSFRFKMDFETITLDSDEEEEVVKVEGGTIEFLETFQLGRLNSDSRLFLVGILEI